MAGSCAGFRNRRIDEGVRFRPDIEMTLSRARQLQADTDSLLAGVIAERRGTGSRHNWVGATRDLEAATDLALYLNGSSRQATLYLAWREQCVRDAVETRWPDIERVAEALLARRSLKGDEVRRIVFQLPLEGSWTGVPDVPWVIGRVDGSCGRALPQ
jgi:hypothetical protein